jgi:chemotaxis protein histidine kinase CheA
MTLSGLDVIARGDDFEDSAASFQLRAWQWAFLHALDGKAELRDIAMVGGIDIDLAIDFVAECEAAGLAHVVSVTLHEYRKANGIEEPAAREQAHEAAPAESMAGYESSVPDWMMQHHEEPLAASAAAPSNGAAHYTEEPVAEHHDEAVAEHHDDAVAEHHDDAVAEHHDEAVAEHHDDAVAEHHDDAVAEHYDEAVAEHHDDAVAEHHDDAVAEHHDDAVAERAPISLEYFGADPATYAEPAYAEPAYAPHDDAARTVADLMSLHQPAPLEVPDEHATPDAPAISFEIGAPLSPVLDHFDAPEPAPSNGHSASNGNGSSYAWEPLSLVTTVDPTPVAFEPESSADVPDGISIRLSPNSGSVVDHAEPEYEAPASEQGSISFSFSPDMETLPAQDNARVEHAAAPPPAEPPSFHTAVSASATAPAPQKVLASSQNDKGDLVGNLIARALTFRIK